MKYTVNEDFPHPQDAEKVVAAGSIFIPAETNVAQNIVDELVKAGTITLVKPDRAASRSKRK